MEDKTTETIIGCAMKVHRALGAGFLESVYANALAHELEKTKITYTREAKIDVLYDNKIIGEFKADFKISDHLILELKAIENLLPIHETQVVNYLKATDIDLGLLLNFGAPSLQIKRKYKTYKKPPSQAVRLHQRSPDHPVNP
ncbi:GxxExxY protein [Verrucomicrobiaceae bacterium N1E253]|uniref:GxxExxY protein n=1 Tax=Oceaniferula marina TaxID=2748318 RepID=A0A851G8M7_9BACT|nr:GxxExxY protein [Oceaniferula marina]NWK54068.1 GxxExxY protein [Oceaniferula marina]